MARPIKEGLDYFPLDTVFSTDVRLIRAEFGARGLVVIIVLMMMIYRERGYYCEYNNDVSLTVAEDCGSGVGFSFVSEIVRACLRRGIFDREMYDKYGILTSEKIQEIYLTAKRKDLSKITKEYLLLKSPKNRVSEEKTGVFVAKTKVNEAESTQNKQNKSKVNKTKVKENKSINKLQTEEKSFDEIREEVCLLVEYDVLMDRTKGINGREVIDNIVDIITEVLEGRKRSYNINGESVAGTAVRARFYKLKMENVEYAVSVLEETRAEIKNIKSYVISLLYNSYGTMGIADLCNSKVI